MFDFTLNTSPKITQVNIGVGQTPLLIIDDFANNPDDIIAFAGDGSLFKASINNFYPGKRLLTPKNYSEALCRKYSALLQKTFVLTIFGEETCYKTIFDINADSVATTIMSALAISDLPPEQLKPIQMLPHIDTTQINQLAVVHYLCGKEHGGTSFYQHKSTGFETITEQRLTQYSTQLKQQAIQARLHKNPRYMAGSNSLFEQTYKVEAKINRAIIYPSNLLHSGNINPLLGLSSVPSEGRLTIGSFITFCSTNETNNAGGCG